MEIVKIALVAAGLPLVSLVLTGCNQANQERTTPNLGTNSSTIQAGQSVASDDNATEAEFQEKSVPKLNDAKLYCLGILLYAEKHQNLFPTNLDRTLPYLGAANRLPSGTNHFDVLYQGSLADLPNPMTNGIIVIRSDPWQGKDGRWTRIYGFADGHCEAHYETEDNFDAWEKQHSVRP